MEKQKLLITTAIDYCNAVIHVGHAYQKILTDAIARHHRLQLGDDNVYFLTGTDEYGTTNEKAAADRDMTPQEHVDDISAQDQEQIDSLNVSYDRFFRTTDDDHAPIAQDFFKRALDAGDIYKGVYEGYYCEGCETHRTHSELTDEGQCPYHPTREIQKLEEENYFFQWDKYTDQLKELVESDRFVLPPHKRNEMLSILNEGLIDKPVSRPKDKVSWGIPVPGDDEQVIYVWFDALVNYYTAGKPNGFWDEDTYILHVLGKDNAIFHVLLWPAMLLSVGERLPDTIYVHDFMNLNGQKISKSLGNVIRPTELTDQYGTDTVRYYFLKQGPITDDVNISIEHLEEVYMGDLANGLGNLVSRTAKLLEKANFETNEADYSDYPLTDSLSEKWNQYRVDLVALEVWKKIRGLDKYLDDTKPWNILKEENPLADEHRAVWQKLVDEIREIAVLVEPFIPEAADKIQDQFAGKSFASAEGLFPRLDN